jgi:hypothetical protein
LFLNVDIFHIYLLVVYNLLRVTEEVMNEDEKNLGDEKPAAETDVAEGNKDSPANEAEEKEPEDKVNVRLHSYCCILQVWCFPTV